MRMNEEMYRVKVKRNINGWFFVSNEIERLLCNYLSKFIKKGTCVYVLGVLKHYREWKRGVCVKRTRMKKEEILQLRERERGRLTMSSCCCLYL